MAVLTRSALESSPLADLHVIAGELGIDGYRRLRKADLVDTIVTRQGGEDAEPEVEEAGVEAPDTEAEAGAEAPDAETDEDEKPRRRRGARGGRARRRDADPEAEADVEAVEAVVVEAEEEGTTDEDAGEEEERPARRSRRGGRSRGAEAEDRVVEGKVELLANGSGFVRLTAGESTDEDVYISAAQVRRCELVDGDAVGGPVREPRRSERFPSLIRIDTINGRPADEVAEGTHFEDLPAVVPHARLALGSEDPTLKAIEWLTPLGRGSRATIVGPEHAGKTEALRLLAGALGAIEDLEVHVVLAGARPEEVTAAKDATPATVAAVSATASAEVQLQAVERAIDTAKRIAARGGHVAVLVDSLADQPAHVARRLLASARAIADGGSLTIVATAPAPVGGETTVIALDRALTRTGRFPALDLVASGTLKAELLVGDAGAEAIAQARANALDG